jgi:transposase
MERLLAQGVSIEKIATRFGKDPATVSYWAAKYGLEPPFKDKHAAKGGIQRELLEGLVHRGMSISQIAEEVGMSKGAVRYWLRRYGLRTHRTRRVESERAGKDMGLAILALRCSRHGETEFVIEGSGYYRCKRCRSEGVARRRRRVKEILAAEAGGRCCVCGYDRYLGALQFHHLDRAEKRLEINCSGAALAIETLRAEARKCVLLCSNCHAEVEGGATLMPARVLVDYQA